MSHTPMPSLAGSLAPVLTVFLAMSALAACAGAKEVHVVYVTAPEASPPNGTVNAEPDPPPTTPGAPEVPFTEPPARSEADVRVGAVTVQPEAAEPTIPPAGPVSWEDAPTLRFESGPWAGCALKRYDSGWIVGRCGDTRIPAYWDVCGGD